MEKKEVIKSALQRATSYEEYLKLIEQLHEDNKATSFQDNIEFYNYSTLGFKRMKRVYKTLKIPQYIEDTISKISSNQTWLIITESWCGDASQTVPILIRLAELNSNITVKISLRDSEKELMKHYLTDGGISIPKLAILDEELNEIGVWGPRPEPAQTMVKTYKAQPDPKPSYSELSAQVQVWYNKDKGETTFKELSALLAS